LNVGALDLGPSGRDAQFGYGLLNISAALTLPPPNPPTVDILGPTVVRPNESCQWSAEVSGGVPPFTYRWLVSYTELGYDQFFSYTNTGSDFVLQVIVKGADFAETTATRNITVVAAQTYALAR
jgi:hypothetical protein